MRRTVQRLAIVFLLASSATAGAESLIEKLLRVAGLTAAPGQMRGPGDAVEFGDIWIASTDGATRTALTSGGGYRSPIFAPTGESIYGLKADTLVRIPSAGGAATPLVSTAGIVKLIGFDSSNASALIVLLDSSTAPLGSLSLDSGKITPLSYDAKAQGERLLLSQITGEERVYGDTRLYVRTETKRGISRTIEWADVYLQHGNLPAINVSGCDGVNCGQPALSPNGRRVVFVKAYE